MIKSISFNQSEIINNIIRLYIPSGKIECDATFDYGGFYKEHLFPEYRFDINPRSSNVKAADCRNLPLESESFNSIIFDPPFLATKGKSLTEENGNIINKRFSVFPDEKSLHQFYTDSMKEFYRILAESGILIFKCQDKVSSGTQYLSHVFIINQAISIGFYPVDIFVLLAKSRLTAKWQLKNQRHARKFHSYFLVLKKSNKRVKYTDIMAGGENNGKI